MRQRAVLHLGGPATAAASAAAALLLLTWAISINCGGIRDKAGALLAGINNADQIKPKFKSTTATATAAAPAPPPPRCDLPRPCPPGHFALRVTSGAADVVGPNICFQGKTIMSHVLNNVGPGLNIVVVDGESGVVEKFGYLNMKAGHGARILAYLKAIPAGAIVLVASYDDVTAKMTKEMREIFVGMGSTLIKSVKVRDSWVFVGRGGTGNRSAFEKRAPNNPRTNIYEKWPATVEVSGCFPRSPHGHTP